MVAAARTLVDLYGRVGPAVSARHGLDYPAGAAAAVRRRLDGLDER
jgi:hypothetical protein